MKTEQHLKLAVTFIGLQRAASLASENCLLVVKKINQNQKTDCFLNIFFRKKKAINEVIHHII